MCNYCYIILHKKLNTKKLLKLKYIIVKTNLFQIICFLIISINVNAQSGVFEIERGVFEIARHGCVEDLQYVLENNSDAINFKNSSGFTPLILASYHGNVEVATHLAKHVKDINVISDTGTALMAAVFKNDIRITKMLLDFNADVNITDANGTTALHYATRLSNEDLVKLLVAYGADLNLKDIKGFSALDYALQNKNNLIIELLKN